jgi:transcriptional regulator with XRE-family HTH domain
MARTLKELIDALPDDERKAIARRSRELIAEEMSLQEVRRAMGKTQATVARRLKIGQHAVSKLETRSDMLISTLRNYLRAFGGDLELVAKLPNREPVRLTSLQSIRPQRAQAQQRRARRTAHNAAVA